ncbi:hypothetical protein BAMA_07910 [Bacillus manliponensis]|uniref:Uncharacterized protein n=1 Tax=Bacillus manliponensis TaxID=574376 RepID=A0A073JUW8_9BACI|nr:hypothetical protein [Bacillus manliponensis]KEK17951.1 hypothetical protein BAMA_07910 [Bacillus manliponensis]
MGESFFDSVGNFFGIGYTTNERKRDEYSELYRYLKRKEKELEKDLKDATSAIKSYHKKDGTLHANKVPAREFEAKRPQKDEELSQFITHFEAALIDVGNAASQAYSKWLEYKAKAEAEEREAAAQNK